MVTFLFPKVKTIVNLYQYLNEHHKLKYFSVLTLTIKLENNQTRKFQPLHTYIYINVDLIVNCLFVYLCLNLCLLPGINIFFLSFTVKYLCIKIYLCDIVFFLIIHT